MCTAAPTCVNTGARIASRCEGEAIQGKALKELKAKGVQIHRWSPEILAALDAAWQEVVQEESAKDGDFAVLADDLEKAERSILDNPPPGQGKGLHRLEMTGVDMHRSAGRGIDPKIHGILPG